MSELALPAISSDLASTLNATSNTTDPSLNNPEVTQNQSFTEVLTQQITTENDQIDNLPISLTVNMMSEITENNLNIEAPSVETEVLSLADNGNELPYAETPIDTIKAKLLSLQDKNIGDKHPEIVAHIASQSEKIQKLLEEKNKNYNSENTNQQLPTIDPITASQLITQNNTVSTNIKLEHSEEKNTVPETVVEEGSKKVNLLMSQRSNQEAVMQNSNAESSNTKNSEHQSSNAIENNFNSTNNDKLNYTLNQASDEIKSSSKDDIKSDTKTLISTLSPQLPLPASVSHFQQIIQNTIHGDNPSKMATTSISMPVNNKDWGAAMSERVVWLSTQKIQGASIHLNPAELGPLEVKINLNNDQAVLNFSSHHAAVREALENALPQLKEMFQQDGLQLVNVNVSDRSFSHNNQATSENNGQRNSDGQVYGSEEEITEFSTPISSYHKSGIIDYYA